MAVVVSQSQNEIDDLKKKGVNIKPHRERMVTEDLDTKFKDPDDPFRIVFVCAMWSTGFDVPSCSTIYLDKPQRNHTLMQTIARTNRVFRDKVNGLIVDYIGVFRDLERALAIYATGADEEGRSPIRDKSELVERLRQAIAEVKEFCANLGVDLAKIEETKTEPFEQVKLIDDAMNSILIGDGTKRDYLQHASSVFKLYKAILPDSAANDFSGICTLINIIARKIRNLTTSADTSNVMTAIEDLLDQSITPADYIIEAAKDYETNQTLDLSQIDFDQLREKFKTQHKQIEIEKLRGAINRKLSQMIRINKTRMDYQEKFEQMIAAYNEAAINTDVLSEQLIALASELNEEEQRAIAEQLSEEELTVFDLLIRPEFDLTKSERNEVKGVAQKLLETLKREKFVLDWRKREQSRAEVKVAVKDILDELPKYYTKDLYNQKCEVVYQHVYDSYYGVGNSIYMVEA